MWPARNDRSVRIVSIRRLYNTGLDGPWLVIRATSSGVSLALWSGLAAAQNLDGRAGEYCIVEPDVGFGYLHPYGLNRGMVVQRASGDPLSQALDKLHRRPLDDVARHAVYLAVVYGLGQVV